VRATSTSSSTGTKVGQADDTTFASGKSGPLRQRPKLKRVFTQPEDHEVTRPTAEAGDFFWLTPSDVPGVRRNYCARGADT